MVKNPFANAGNMGWIPGQETEIPHSHVATTGPVSPN